MADKSAKPEFSKEKFSNYLKERTDFSIYLTSTVFSGYFAYRYLKNKFVMKEYHGHFNSPQNLLNKKLTTHYLKDALARFGLGFVVLTLSQMGIKYYLDGYIQDVAIVTIEEDEEYKNIFIEKNDIQEAIKRRENVNKYLNKN
jgi:hypothetical protein